MTIEELIDLQEAGARARVLGLKSHENPYLAPHSLPTGNGCALGDWLARHDAWKFGWEAEDAGREGKIVAHFKELISAEQQALNADLYGRLSRRLVRVPLSRRRSSADRSFEAK